MAQGREATLDARLEVRDSTNAEMTFRGPMGPGAARGRGDLPRSGIETARRLSRFGWLFSPAFVRLLHSRSGSRRQGGGWTDVAGVETAAVQTRVW